MDLKEEDLQEKFLPDSLEEEKKPKKRKAMEKHPTWALALGTHRKATSEKITPKKKKRKLTLMLSGGVVLSPEDQA